jgi:hypothetical protein
MHCAIRSLVDSIFRKYFMKNAYVLLFLLSAMSIALAISAAESGGVPKEAMAEMQYRVGKWQSTAWIDGIQQAQPSSEITKWVEGKYCIQIASSYVDKGKDIDQTALVGWDADKKQLVEHWYDSNGGYASYRYFLGKKKDSWVGSFTEIYADGKKLEGESIVDKKGPDEWEWNASYMDAGKKHTWRTINRRVK